MLIATPRLVLLLLFAFGAAGASPASAQFRIEAETGTVSDPNPTDGQPGAEVRTFEASIFGPFTGTGFVALQKGAVTLDISWVPEGRYTLSVRYASPFGTKFESIAVGGVVYGNSTECIKTFRFGKISGWGWIALEDPAMPTVTLPGSTRTLVISACSGGTFFDSVTLMSVESVAADAEAGPGGLELRQNAPNPFAAATDIAYTLGESGHVRLDVYDVTGRRVAALVDAVQPAGAHAARFDAAGLASGVYVYRLQTSVGVRTERMLHVR